MLLKFIPMPSYMQPMPESMLFGAFSRGSPALCACQQSLVFMHASGDVRQTVRRPIHQRSTQPCALAWHAHLLQTTAMLWVIDRVLVNCAISL